MKLVRDLNTGWRTRAACTHHDTEMFFGPDQDETQIPAGQVSGMVLILKRVDAADAIANDQHERH